MQEFRHEREQAVTDEVVASFAGAPDDRLREIVQGLTRHLHAFAREVRLTEQEWTAAIDFLTRVGHITDDKRQEFILLSDVLGLSMLTVAINAPADPQATESTVFGPFFVDGRARGAARRRHRARRAGHPVLGRPAPSARRTATPLPGARIDVWEADEDGFYDVQYADDRSGRRGRGCAPGRRRIPLLVGAPRAVPDPGRRPGRRPAHRHRPRPDAARAPALQGRRAGAPHPRHAHLRRRRPVPGRRDAVFGVKDSLVVDFTEHPAGHRARRPRARHAVGQRPLRHRAARRPVGPWTRGDADTERTSETGRPGASAVARPAAAPRWRWPRSASSTW